MNCNEILKDSSHGLFAKLSEFDQIERKMNGNVTYVNQNQNNITMQLVPNGCDRWDRIPEETQFLIEKMQVVGAFLLSPASGIARFPACKQEIEEDLVAYIGSSSEALQIHRLRTKLPGVCRR